MTEKNIRILCVEDDDVDSEALERRIKKKLLPYDLTTAATEKEAVDALCSFEFDIVLLGFSLRTATGLDILPRVGDAPVIFVTGKGSEEIAIEAMRRGAYDYLIKDPDRDYLKILPMTIRNALKRKHAETAFKASEERFRALTENTTDITVIFDKDRVFHYVNPAVRNALGYSHEEVIGKNLFDVLHPDDARIADKKIDQAIRTPGNSTGLNDFRIRRRDGGWVYLAGSIIYMPDVSSVDGIVGNFQNSTSRKRAEEKLAASRRELDSIIRTVPDIIYRLDANSRITFISDSIKQYGLRPEMLLGASIFDLVYPMDREKATYRINERRAGVRRTKSFEIRLTTKTETNASFGIFSVSAEGLYAAKRPNPTDFLGSQGIARDITQRKRVENELHEKNRQLEAMSNTDALTKIANRRHFDTAIERECKRLSRHQSTLSLIMCDIDYFKRFNDTYGHQAGDECLIKVAETIRAAAQRDSDCAARYGGEEFAVILPDTKMERAALIAEKMRAAIENLDIHHENSLVAEVVTMSFGIASLSSEESGKTCASILIAKADEGLYEAKSVGRNRVARWEVL